MAKTAVAKKLAKEIGVSVRKAERQLNAYLFLDKIPQLESGGPHHPTSFRGCLHKQKMQDEESTTTFSGEAARSPHWSMMQARRPLL